MLYIRTRVQRDCGNSKDQVHFTSVVLVPKRCKVAEIHRDKDRRRDDNQAGGEEEESKAKQINQSMVTHSTGTRERNAGRPGMSSEVTVGAHGTISKGQNSVAPVTPGVSDPAQSRQVAAHALELA